MSLRAQIAWALPFALSLHAGCVGSFDSPSGALEGEWGADGKPGGSNAPLECTERSVGPAPLQHLTRVEYVRTLRDLVNVEVSLSDLPGDDDTHGYEMGTTVSSLLVESYARGAEKIASQVALTQLLGCDPASGVGVDGATGEQKEDECARAFIARFARRAYRRPLVEEDRNGLFAVFDAGRDALGFEGGVRLVVEAVLQSPSFLYHVHDAGSADQNGLRELTPAALADRLSYLVWGSMPDDALLDHVEAKDLSDQTVLESEARRMLQARPDAARLGFLNFARQWLGLDKLDTLTRDSTRYPQFSPQVARDLRSSLERQLEEAFNSDGLSALLDADSAFVNANIAPLFGATAQGDTLVEVTLDPAQRRGLLTHPGLLAALSKPNQSDPVIRGKFVRERFMCQQLAPPPPNVATTPPDPAPGSTTRERFAEHSLNDTCAGCHRLMDPIGFGLEHYDALGAYRMVDEGVPVDASGEIMFSADLDGKFNGGVELAGKLAESASVRDCIATQFFRYAVGRTETKKDACSLQKARDEFAATGGDFKELLVKLVKTDAFRYREDP